MAPQARRHGSGLLAGLSCDRLCICIVWVLRRWEPNTMYFDANTGGNPLELVARNCSKMRALFRV